MNAKLSVTHGVLWHSLLLLSSLPLRAEQFGLFTYQLINGTSITITDYPDNATGPVEIPAGIAGKPVTNISDDAFSGCTGLTSLSIPSSILSIGEAAFDGCAGLISINVAAENPNYAAIEGVLFNELRTHLIKYPEGKAGPYTLPSSVTDIDPYAFYYCTELTSVTLSSSLSRIGVDPFWGCSLLKSVNLPASLTTIDFKFSGYSNIESINVEIANPKYASYGGVLFNKTLTQLVEYPGGKSGAYALPPSVTSIGANAFQGCTELTQVTFNPAITSIPYAAFYDCTGLTSLTIPSSILSIGDYAFEGCTGLTTAIFLENAPSMSENVFTIVAPGFSLYYLSSRAGFTSPTWLGYPSTRINETTYPAASWLLEHGLWYDTNLQGDPDGDGVNLLLAYALNIDPTIPQRSQMPVPILTGATLELNFPGWTWGILYRAETSADLNKWTTTGVTQSAPGPDGRITASVPMDVPSRFLRIVVTQGN